MAMCAEGLPGADLGVVDGVRYALAWERRNHFACRAKVYERRAGETCWRYVDYAEDVRRPGVAEAIARLYRGG
jgi:hypothetical protein